MPWQRKTSLWGGWAVRGPRHNFWFAGDTGCALLFIRCPCPTLERHHACDRGLFQYASSESAKAMFLPV